MKDSYRTIESAAEVSFFKEKGSKFYGYAFPVLGKEEVNIFLEELRKAHPSANHICYAWQLGVENPSFHLNDDGEPNNSAGMPIHGQIRSFDLTNVFIAVVRYFGGTKLGVGGLKQAYKYSAMLTLENAAIVEKTIDVHYQLRFAYDLMNPVMRVIKEKQIKILHQNLGIDCVFTISIRKKEEAEVLERFKQLYKVKVKLVS